MRGCLRGLLHGGWGGMGACVVAPGGASMTTLGGACVVAPSRACVVAPEGCVWLLGGMGDMCGCLGGCVVALGGHVWLLQGCMVVHPPDWRMGYTHGPLGGAWLLRGGMHGCSGGCVVVLGGMRGCSQGACMVAPPGHAWYTPGACVTFSMRYSHRAAGAHPTGMHSCFF